MSDSSFLPPRIGVIKEFKMPPTTGIKAINISNIETPYHKVRIKIARWSVDVNVY